MRPHLPLVLISLLASVPAAALDLPPRKAGLWDIKMNLEGRNLPVTGMQQCVDAETDKLMNSIGGSMREACSKQDMQKVGNTIVVDSVCKIGESTTTSHGVITGDFNSAYTVKVTSKHTGGPAIPGRPADGTTTMTIEAKWMGACKPDQKPGDIIMSTGMKMNIRDMQNLPGRTPGPPPAKK
jgi:hypothetical protein